jgi:hypothetical protein
MKKYHFFSLLFSCTLLLSLSDVYAQHYDLTVSKDDLCNAVNIAPDSIEFYDIIETEFPARGNEILFLVPEYINKSNYYKTKLKIHILIYDLFTNKFKANYSKTLACTDENLDTHINREFINSELMEIESITIDTTVFNLGMNKKTFGITARFSSFGSTCTKQSIELLSIYEYKNDSIKTIHDGIILSESDYVCQCQDCFYNNIIDKSGQFTNGYCDLLVTKSVSELFGDIADEEASYEERSLGIDTLKFTNGKYTNNKH